VVTPILERAYAHCDRLARNHYENFPVASRLLPRPMRPHIAAIYAFARRADDFADEPGRDAGERLGLLDDWEARLRHAIEAGASLPRGSRLAAAGAQPDDDDLIFVALGDTVRRCSLPPALLTDLLSAFRQDVTTARYATWADVLDYCRRSANPVGRLVLRVAGYDDPALDGPSDAVCTALQLTNFWQDIHRDWATGRLYIPQDDLTQAGALESDLSDQRMSAGWRTVLAAMMQRTRELFDTGREVCDGVHGRLRWELRLTWLGGSRVLEKVARARRESFVARPTLGFTDVPVLLRDALLWRAGRRAETRAPIAG
jgi:phytoene synthase